MDATKEAPLTENSPAVSAYIALMGVLTPGAAIALGETRPRHQATRAARLRRGAAVPGPGDTRSSGGR